MRFTVRKTHRSGPRYCSPGSWYFYICDFIEDCVPPKAEKEILTWQLIGEVDGEAAGDMAGNRHGVSLSGDGLSLALSSIWNLGSSTSNRGSVRVFAVDRSGLWTQRGQDLDGEGADDWSGWCAALDADGTLLAVSAPQNDPSETLMHAGHVRVYSFDGVAWVQLGEDIDGGRYSDLSGSALDLSVDGRMVAIGVPVFAQDTYLGTSGAPHVEVWNWDVVNARWSKLGADLTAEDGPRPDPPPGAPELDGPGIDAFGGDVSLSNDGYTLATVVSYAGESHPGSVRVYARRGSSWSIVDELNRATQPWVLHCIFHFCV